LFSNVTNHTGEAIIQLKIWHSILSVLADIGVKPEDDTETRLQKLILIKTSVLISIAAVIWGILYLTFGEVKSGFIPIIYAILSIISLFILKISNNFELFRLSQITLILILPFLLMLQLGGFINGSIVILWALLAPVGALLSGQLRQAVFWFIAFNFLVLLSGILQPYLRQQNNLPDEVINLLFIINILTVSLITFIVLNYFVKHKDRVIELMRRNKELEDTRVKNEMLIRESDKLATLGRLSAGITHELNNPATAALSGSMHLKNTIPKLEKYMFDLNTGTFSDEQIKLYNRVRKKIHTYSNNSQTQAIPVNNDPEEEFESWLQNNGIENYWEIAPMLTGLDIEIETLSRLKDNFPGEQFRSLILSLFTLYESIRLLDEISQGSERIIEIVKSLKTYSYQQKNSAQYLDIHEGINNTLVMMRSQLKKGVTVEREFSHNLPDIKAYGNELNQVWTNIIDNAITAMNGKGKLSIKTFQDDNWLVVQISDTGQGMTNDIKKKIFDPFFTTKPLGAGTGLGLNISYNTIVNRHKGKINVLSVQGKTCFEIRLPVNDSLT